MSVELRRVALLVFHRETVVDNMMSSFPFFKDKSGKVSRFKTSNSGRSLDIGESALKYELRRGEKKLQHLRQPCIFVIPHRCKWQNMQIEI